MKLPKGDFLLAWDALAEDVNDNAHKHGFWDEVGNNGEKLALIHSEISEALEALRSPDVWDKHCPKFKAVEVELADAVIRIMDLAHQRGWMVSDAIFAKHEYNKARPYKHGKVF